MTNEIIDKYIDQQGITTGEWEVNIGVFSDACVISNADTVAECNTSPETFTAPFERANAVLIANSRKSLRDWIMVAWKIESTSFAGLMFRLATENIEASLGKTWSQVQEELEAL